MSATEAASVLLSLYLLTSICIIFCSISCFAFADTLEYNNSSSDLWQSWLVNEDDGTFQQNSSPVARRITPKSVFIAPSFDRCTEGYRPDGMGGCVKIVKINEAVQWDFLLQKLNSMYAATALASTTTAPPSSSFTSNDGYGYGGYGYGSTEELTSVHMDDDQVNYNVRPSLPPIRKDNSGGPFQLSIPLNIATSSTTDTTDASLVLPADNYLFLSLTNATENKNYGSSSSSSNNASDFVTGNPPAITAVVNITDNTNNINKNINNNSSPSTAIIDIIQQQMETTTKGVYLGDYHQPTDGEDVKFKIQSTSLVHETTTEQTSKHQDEIVRFFLKADQRRNETADTKAYGTTTSSDASKNTYGVDEYADYSFSTSATTTTATATIPGRFPGTGAGDDDDLYAAAVSIFDDYGVKEMAKTQVYDMGMAHIFPSPTSVTTSTSSVISSFVTDTFTEFSFSSSKDVTRSANTAVTNASVITVTTEVTSSCFEDDIAGNNCTNITLNSSTSDGFKLNDNVAAVNFKQNKNTFTTASTIPPNLSVPVKFPSYYESPLDEYQFLKYNNSAEKISYTDETIRNQNVPVRTSTSADSIANFLLQKGNQQDSSVGYTEKLKNYFDADNGGSGARGIIRYPPDVSVKTNEGSSYGNKWQFTPTVTSVRFPDFLVASPASIVRFPTRQSFFSNTVYNPNESNLQKIEIYQYKNSPQQKPLVPKKDPTSSWWWTTWNNSPASSSVQTWSSDAHKTLQSWSSGVYHGKTATNDNMNIPMSLQRPNRIEWFTRALDSK